jgi:hypothetical protein
MDVKVKTGSTRTFDLAPRSKIAELYNFSDELDRLGRFESGWII